MMMRIGPSAWPQGAAASALSRPEPGFRLRARQAAVGTAAVPVSGGLWALGATLPSPRDVLARRRGRAMLSGLGELQRALLAGQPESGALQSLAGLVEGEDGEDPEMAEAMQALALRARIELARRGVEREAAAPTSR